MSEPFLGEIRIFGGNFAPQGWMLCNGAVLPIQQFTALFSILGITYGGNGTTNFALPNLQGAAPMNAGAGPGLTPRELGESAGSPTVTLLQTSIPSHNHGATASQTDGVQSTPLVLAEAPIYGADPATGSSRIVAMAPVSIGPAGGNQPHDNMQPYLGMTFIIAYQGIYPARP
jgi:microcystin-dependent protein